MIRPTLPTALALPRLMPAMQRPALFAAVVLVLAGCATQPSPNISRIPSDQIEAQTSKDGLFTQPIKWERRKPGCEGECPELKVDSLVFPGNGKLTELVDHALASMTGMGADAAPRYSTIQEYEAYFWRTAAPRDSAILSARARYRNSSLTVVELTTGQYFTGAAHGITSTQFLNWDNQRGKVLGLDDVLRTGGRSQFTQALRQAHNEWLAGNPDMQADPDGYLRLWPFQDSDNFAFTDQGIVVKYDPYQIAPYSSGQPELLIPYDRLSGALRPEFIPAPTH